MTVLAALVPPTATVPNASVAGLIDKGRLPVPVRATICGESGAVSLMESEPVTAPDDAGVNVKPTWQLPPAARLDPQVFVEIAKSPLGVIEFTVTAVALAFLMVTIFTALDVVPES